MIFRDITSDVAHLTLELDRSNSFSHNLEAVLKLLGTSFVHQFRWNEGNTPSVSILAAISGANAATPPLSTRPNSSRWTPHQLRQLLSNKSPTPCESLSTDLWIHSSRRSSRDSLSVVVAATHAQLSTLLSTCSKILLSENTFPSTRPSVPQIFVQEQLSSIPLHPVYVLSSSGRLTHLSTRFSYLTSLPAFAFHITVIRSQNV